MAAWSLCPDLSRVAAMTEGTARRTAAYVSAYGCCRPIGWHTAWRRESADGIQHHDRNLPSARLDLVVGIGREERHRLLPQPRPFLARGGAGAPPHLLGAD